MPLPRYSLRDLFALIFWLAVALAALMTGLSSPVPNRQSFDLLARFVDLGSYLVMAAASGAAIGVVLKRQLACTLVAIVFAVYAFFALQ